MLPQSPRHALLALALSSMGFLGPWVLGGWQTAEPPPTLHAELPPLRVVHVSLPPVAESPTADLGPSTDAQDEVEEPSTAPEPQTDQPPQGGSLIAVVGPGPLLRGELEALPGVGTGTSPQAERKANKPGRPRRKATRKECLPDREDVAQVQDSAYRIEDDTVYFYANHPREAEALAATWWAKDDDDAIAGFKVGRIPCGALLEQLGFKNGDVIKQVNGLPITTYGDAINAYMTLRRKRILWVDVERRGEPVRLDYVLVGSGEAADEVDPSDPLSDPTALVDAELDADELPWMRRVVEKRRLRRITR